MTSPVSGTSIRQEKTLIIYSSLKVLVKCECEKAFFEMKEGVREYPANSIHLQMIKL